MQYRVIKMFTDLQDKEYAYQVGDIYPHEGLSPTDERIAELSSNRNRRGMPLIEEIPDTVDVPETEETDVPDTDVGEITEKKPRKRKRKGDE